MVPLSRRLHPRRLVTIARHEYRAWTRRKEPLPEDGRLEPAWDPDYPLSGSPEATYTATKFHRTTWRERRQMDREDQRMGRENDLR